MVDWNREQPFHATGSVLQQLNAKGYWSRPKQHAGTLSNHQLRLLTASVTLGLDSGEFFAIRHILQTGGFDDDSLLLLLLCERLACNEGSTYLGLDAASLGVRLASLNCEDQWPSIQALLDALPEQATPLVRSMNGEQEHAPLLLSPDKKRLYRQAFYWAEQHVANNLQRRIAKPWQQHPQLAEVFDAIHAQFPLHRAAFNTPDNHPIQLAPEQAEAALVATCAPLTLIAGGPGTGKTSVVVTILRLLAKSDVPLAEIALAAPTGRAANRLRESIAAGMASVDPQATSGRFDPTHLEPTTLHRLLGWRRHGGGFRYGRDRKLHVRWLFLDEASMVDISMMESLLDALPETCHLVMLGDAHQLPSVDAGAVFRDLTAQAFDTEAQTAMAALAVRGNAPAGLARHVVQLRRTYRQTAGHGDRIREAASAVNTGDAKALLRLMQAKTRPAITDKGLIWITPDSCPLSRLLQDCFHQHWQPMLASVHGISGGGMSPNQTDALRSAFQQMDALKILCLTRQTERGVDRINQAFLNLARHYGSGDFIEGVPWMVTHNDYRLSVFNGDVGLAVRVRSDEGSFRALAIADDQSIRLLPFNGLRNPVPAFALTVHKSQGSECRHVVLILPKQPHMLCKREVIYTALTRAKESVWIYGNETIITTSVQETLQRETGLTQTMHMLAASDE